MDCDRETKFDAERGDPRGKKAPVEDVSRRFSTLHA